MKTYTVTLKLRVSAENQPLVPFVVSRNGGAAEGETSDEGACRVLGDRLLDCARATVVNPLTEYFGVRGEAERDALIAAIDGGALTVTAEVTEEHEN